MKNKRSLKIENLYASTIDGTEILKGINLDLHKGEVLAIMGPNGAGKSTLAQVIMGHPGYQVTKGRIFLDQTNISSLPVDERARLGLFLGFQYPSEVEGVNYASFLRMAVNQRLYKDKVFSPILFREKMRQAAKNLNFGQDITKRSLNTGFSGGEKKKSEVLQLSLLKPKYAILDEPDSGLDIDALRYIAKPLNKLRTTTGLLLITHYQRLLDFIEPDKIAILVDGRVVDTGNSHLVKRIEKQGYEPYLKLHDNKS